VPILVGYLDPKTHGSLDPLESPSQTESVRFSLFCTAHQRAQHTGRHTQTTLRAISVAIGRIYALSACNVA